MATVLGRDGGEGSNNIVIMGRSNCCTPDTSVTDTDNSHHLRGKLASIVETPHPHPRRTNRCENWPLGWYVPSLRI
jgi:hypothetical protein